MRALGSCGMICRKVRPLKTRQPIPFGGDDKFRFMRVRQYPSSNRDQRRGQLRPHGVMPEQCPAGAVLREPGRTCDVKVAEEPRRLDEVPPEC